MLLVDCHTHTALSGHGEGSPADVVRHAEELGLDTLALTEHLWLPESIDPEHGDSMSEAQTRRYLEDLEHERGRLADEGSSLKLVIGTEADWLDGREAELCRICSPFEYVLGSVHFVDGLAIDYAPDVGAWPALGVDGTWRRYLECWLDMVSSKAPFTAFSHPDLPKKYGRYPSFDLSPWFEEMAQAVSGRGALVEVNTSGLRRDVHEMYPSLELLAAFRRAGVECTVGSDAHRPQEVGADIELAYSLMRAAGYERVAVPTSDGDRHYIELEA